jgi:hypothetical protein
LIDLAELGRELNTQDNAATAYPLYLVQQQRRIWGMDPDIDDIPFVWAWAEDSEYSFPDDEVRAEIRRDNDTAQALTDDEIDPEDWGYERRAYVNVWDFVCAHLTRRAAQRYIDENRHRLSEPRIYVGSQYRCHEFNAVVDWLKAQGEPTDA